MNYNLRSMCIQPLMGWLEKNRYELSKHVNCFSQRYISKLLLWNSQNSSTSFKRSFFTAKCRCYNYSYSSNPLCLILITLLAFVQWSFFLPRSTMVSVSSSSLYLLFCLRVHCFTLPLFARSCSPSFTFIVCNLRELSVSVFRYTTMFSLVH